MIHSKPAVVSVTEQHKKSTHNFYAVVVRQLPHHTEGPLIS